ncbi:MAG: HD domain-containing protein [Deltaproteobacteria bacterium]|nr:HD domain-containing protein [Deltaproteobacteria bacterium]
MPEQAEKTLRNGIRDDALIRVVSETAVKEHISIFIVGGWIRDCLLGRHSDDYDFIVGGDAHSLAEAVARRVGGTSFSMGQEAPYTYRVVVDGKTLDFVSQGIPELTAELARRDFTVNTLTWSCGDERLFDPFNGLSDLLAKIIRMVSPDVFHADPLRMLRAVRLAAVLKGFRIDAETEKEIRRHPDALAGSAVERIREEIDRILLSGRAADGLEKLRSLGLLFVVFPELKPLSGLAQGPYHHLDALEHTFKVVASVDGLAGLCGTFSFPFELGREDRRVLAWSTLLHDLGKKVSSTIDASGVPHFYGHEKTGAEIVGAVTTRFSFPKRRAERIRRLVRYHVRGLGLVKDGFTDRALRRIIARLEEDLPLHVLLSLADRRAARGRNFGKMEQRTVALGQALLDLYAAKGEEVCSPPVLVTGDDVMNLLGVSPGPAIGAILSKIRALQVDGEIGTREEALAFLRNHLL